MKIGILTQPLHNNYGGLLQAFALQKVLNNLGHDVITLNLVKKDTARLMKILSVCKRLLLFISKGGRGIIRIWPTKGESLVITKNTTDFVKKHIKITERISGDFATQFLRQLNVDAYIVGSDQVWRPKYSPHLPTFFLDFVTNPSSIKCLAYAASFGVDSWEFNNRQTAMARTEIRKFHAISVREDSAVELCNQYLDCKTTQVLDPTMLLTMNDYKNIFKLDQLPESEGKLFTYILDETPEKKILINKISQKLGIQSFNVMPKKKFSDVGAKGLQETVYPKVEIWLRAYLDSEFVITDSFHGTVFAIVNQVPFLTLRNHDRGLARFVSLLNLFGLQDRLIFTNKHQEIETKLNQEINWSHVDKILNIERKKSLSFIHLSLA